jgi:hypothetical protein
MSELKQHQNLLLHRLPRCRNAKNFVNERGIIIFLLKRCVPFLLFFLIYQYGITFKLY